MSKIWRCLKRRDSIGSIFGTLLILRFVGVKLITVPKNSDSVTVQQMATGERRFCDWKTSWWLGREFRCYECSSSKCRPLSLVRTSCGTHPSEIAWDPRVQRAYGNTWTLFSDGHTYSGHPSCSVRTCWALDRCAANDPISMYIPYHSFPRLNATLLQYAIHRKLVQVVHDDPESACIVLLTDGMYSSIQNFSEALSDGQNRLIWDASQIRFPQDSHVRLSGDDAFPSFHIGKAIMASVALNGAAHMRPSYDIVLPLPRKWGCLPVNIHEAENRTYLLAFRGQWKNRQRPYYLHRWMAYAYWESREDVYVDLKCVEYYFGGLWPSMLKEYDEDHQLSYDDLLYDSTFGFAPGGSGPGSFRFGEILSAGGIPVVTPDTVLPFWPALDWSSCVVQVSESSLVDLPSILRKISLQSIAKRRKVCQRLMLLTYGETLDPKTKRYLSDPRQIFFTSMSIIRNRIQEEKLEVDVAWS